MRFDGRTAVDIECQKHFSDSRFHVARKKPFWKLTKKKNERNENLHFENRSTENYFLGERASRNNFHLYVNRFVHLENQDRKSNYQKRYIDDSISFIFIRKFQSIKVHAMSTK